MKNNSFFFAIYLLAILGTAAFMLWLIFDVTAIYYLVTPEIVYSLYDYGDDLLNHIQLLSFGIYDWTIVFGLLFFSIEILNEIVTKRFSKKTLRESFGSAFTQIPYYFSEALLFSGAVFFFFGVYELIPWKMPVTIGTAFLVLILGDLIYYIEHRLAHRIRILWVAHTVHHSAQSMNTSTAFRFSIIDPLISSALYFPLILMGFHPVLIIAAELLVQSYQFWIHNEMIPKMGLLEYILNTPSSHRVHHARTPSYRDKNYGGIFIIWDRLFNTYQSEDKELVYGLPDQINSWNPIEVQLHEIPRLKRDLQTATSLNEKMKILFSPPEWIRTREKLFGDTK